MKIPKRKLLGLTWVGWLNLMALQWACFRLAYVTDRGGALRGWRFVGPVLPLTGWWSPYLFLWTKRSEAKERDAALERAEKAEALAEKRGEALRWVADQSCTQDAPGAAEDTPCSETSACVTEWCLPCYARAALRSDEAKVEPLNHAAGCGVHDGLLCNCGKTMPDQSQPKPEGATR